jgi:hypothetical protein
MPQLCLITRIARGRPLFCQPPSPATLPPEPDASRFPQFGEQALNLGAGNAREHLLQLRYLATALIVPEVPQKKLLVRVTIEPPPPRVDAGLAHRAVEPPTQQVPRAPTPPNRLDGAQLDEPPEAGSEFLGHRFVAVDQVEDQELVRVE